jgi:hypothetical protein
VTGAIGDGIPPDRSPRFFEIEYLVDDFNKFSDLACGARQAGALSEATRGQLQLSARHREIFGPLGIGEDVRIAEPMVAAGATWFSIAIRRARSARTRSRSCSRWRAVLRWAFA